MAAGQDGFQYTGGEGIRMILEQQADVSGDRLARYLSQRSGVQGDVAGCRRAQTCQRVQQRCFASAIASQYPPALAAIDVNDRSLQTVVVPMTACSACVASNDITAQRASPCRMRLWCSSIRKTGTPTSAVSMPTGSCRGASRVRARVSATTSRLPPSNAAAGNSSR